MSVRRSNSVPYPPLSRSLPTGYQALHALCAGRTIIAGSNPAHRFEAVLRWTPPERGAVSSMAFMPLTEEVGLVAPIGAWVLRTACREAMTWPESAAVAVNISPHQFEDGYLVETVLAARRYRSAGDARWAMRLSRPCDPWTWKTSHPVLPFRSMTWNLGNPLGLVSGVQDAA